MTSFDDRQKGFETAFARDADLQFRVTARRNRLLGMWAAGVMGLSGDEAAEYAKTVVAADFEEAGDEDVIRKVVGDVAGHGANEADVRAQLAVQFAEARRQIMETM